MGTDPEPYHPIGYGDTEGTVAEADSNRPELANLFKVERRVAWIVFKDIEIGICQLLDDWWKMRVALPKTGGSVVNQSGLHLPAP
jgi:hypothetical protein